MALGQAKNTPANAMLQCDAGWNTPPDHVLPHRKRIFRNGALRAPRKENPP
jgi:hypothetical protein